MNSYRLVKPYFVEKRVWVLVGLFSLFVVDILQLFIPRIIKWAVDDLTIGSVKGANLVRYALYVIAVALVIGVFRYIWRRCLIGTSRRVEEGLRNRLFAHIQNLSAGYFDKTKTGDLMARATNDVQHVRMAVGMGMVALTDAVVLTVAAIGFMLYINVTLTLLALLPMPIIVILTRVITKKMHRLYKDVQASFSDLTEVVRERFAGIRVIKAYNREDAELEKLSGISRDYVKKNIHLVRITGSLFPGMTFMTNVSVVIVLFLGGRLAIELTITPGDFVAFISYLGLMTWPMMAMGWVINLIQRGRASLDRIDEILQTSPQIVSPPDPEPSGRMEGKLVFEDVGFRYGPDLPVVLSGISFSLRAGHRIGIVGPTGSGKTTLCHMIPRLLDVTTGRVMIDDVDIRRRSLKWLRSNIAVVPQDAFLFSGSIRDNLMFGKEDATLDQMVAATRAAHLYDTIESFPHGFDTLIGERGVTLSGGQKQRLALARALLSSLPMLILDDPLSQVDVDTAAIILGHVQEIWRVSTTVMVSHRINQIKDSDVILVLENGRISDMGTHEELKDRKGFYQDMYYWQEIEEGRYERVEG